MKLMKVTIPARLGGRKLAVFAAAVALFCAVDGAVITNANDVTVNVELGSSWVGGGAPGGDVGGALHMDSLGGPGDDTTGDVNGTEATTPMSQAPQMDAGIPLQETLRRRIGGAQQTPKSVKLSFMEQYFNMLNESRERAEEDYDEVDYIGKADIVNDGLKKSIEKLQKLSEEFNKRYTDEDEELMSENEAFEEE